MDWTFSRHPDGLILKGAIPGGGATTIVSMPAEPADRIVHLQADVDRLTKLLTQIHTIAKDGLDGGDDYEAMREIETLSGGG